MDPETQEGSEESGKNKKNEDLKIVVVDDSEFSRKGIVEILDAEGYNVVGDAGSAAEAIKMTHSNPGNVYIIDVVMPEASGIDLAKFITENVTDVFIIMISSLVTESIIIDAISNGAIDFIQKPFEKEDLIKSIEKIATEIEKNKED